MSDIYACSACTFRHGYNDMQKLEKCCYETCEQFDTDCRKHCSECIKDAKTKCNGGSKCKLDSSIEYINTTPLHFKMCSLQSVLDKDALRCCFRKCENDYECQEKCIDAYNAMRPVTVEEFTGKSDKTILFLILGLSFVFVRNVEFPKNKWVLLIFVTLFYIAIFHLINCY